MSSLFATGHIEWVEEEKPLVEQVDEFVRKWEDQLNLFPIDDQQVVTTGTDDISTGRYVDRYMAIRLFDRLVEALDGEDREHLIFLSKRGTYETDEWSSKAVPQGTKTSYRMFEALTESEAMKPYLDLIFRVNQDEKDSNNT